VNDIQRALAVILFPVTVLSIGMFLWTSWYVPPAEAVSIDVQFGLDHVNVSELWVSTADTDTLTRTFPFTATFANLSVTSTICRGQSYFAYDGRYSVSCEGDLGDLPLFGIKYTLHDPYSCYDDMCYFEGKFFEDVRAKPIAFRVLGANDYEFFPGTMLENPQGDFSAAFLFASLPSHYEGAEYEGDFYERFLGIKEKYRTETRLESRWGSNLLLVMSFESFMAFLLFLIMGLEPEIESSGNSWFPPYLRPPHELSSVFFPGLPRDNVISATIIDLAQKGHLEVERKELRLKSTKVPDPFQDRVLKFLLAVSSKKKIKLEREWLHARAKEVGSARLRKMIADLVPECPPELVEEAHDKMGDYFVLLLQAAFIMLAVGMYALAPAYLINFRASLVVLMIINVFWIVLTLRLGYMTFSKYTHAAALEKAGWLAYRNFTRSEVNLEKETRLNWDYLLVFATLFGFESRVLKVADRKSIHFKNIYNSQLAVNAFELIKRSVSW
jgi:hypothetical protein